MPYILSLSISMFTDKREAARECYQSTKYIGKEESRNNFSSRKWKSAAAAAGFSNSDKSNVQITTTAIFPAAETRCVDSFKTSVTKNWKDCVFAIFQNYQSVLLTKWTKHSYTDSFDYKKNFLGYDSLKCEKNDSWFNFAYKSLFKL